MSKSTIIVRSLAPRAIHPQVKHPRRPVAGPLLRYPDGHYSIRARFLGSHHGVSQRDAAALLRVIRSSRKGARQV